MSKFNQKQAKRNFVIQIYYPEEEIPIKSTIIITENCSLLALILFACSWNICKWNYTEYNILCLASFTKQCFWDLPMYVSCNSYVLFLSNSQLGEYILFCFSAFLLREFEHSCVSLFEDICFYFLWRNT